MGSCAREQGRRERTARGRGIQTRSPWRATASSSRSSCSASVGTSSAAVFAAARLRELAAGSRRWAPARWASMRVAARPRERQPSALAGHRGSARQHAHRRLPQPRQSGASDSAMAVDGRRPGSRNWQGAGRVVRAIRESCFQFPHRLDERGRMPATRLRLAGLADGLSTMSACSRPPTSLESARFARCRRPGAH